MSFAPKHKVELDPPKDDPISADYLAKCDGKNEGYPTYVAIKARNSPQSYPKPNCFEGLFVLTGVGEKGTVFDVTGNKSYEPGASYNVFAGKDASRALAQSSLKPEDCRPEWEDLAPEHQKVLNDWFTFFSKRYNVKGKVQQSASNL